MIPTQYVGEVLRQRLMLAAEAARQVSTSGPVQTVASLLGTFGMDEVELLDGELAVVGERQFGGEVPHGIVPGRMIPTQLKSYTVAVPFHGDPAAVTAILSECLHEPRWTISGSELRAVFTVEATLPGQQVRAQIDERVRDAARHIDNGQAAVSKYRADLMQVINGVLDRVAADHAAGEAQRDELGLPVRITAPAPSAPVSVAPAQRSTTAGDPAKTADDLFETVMAQVEAIGRDLGNFTGLNHHLTLEGHTRDVLLLVLRRAVPECDFTAETQHGQGKNDIHVRHNGQVVCIIELKKWTTETEFKDGVDQLLSYLPYRDTRGAYVLLIRTQDVSSVVAKTKQWLLDHANCTDEQVPAGQWRSNYEYHATGDAAQSIRIVYLPVPLSTSATGNSANRGLAGTPGPKT